MTNTEKTINTLRDACSKEWGLRLPSGLIINPNSIDLSASEKQCIVAQSPNRVAAIFSPGQIFVVESVFENEGFNCLWIQLEHLFITPNVRNYSPSPMVEKLTEVVPGIYLKPEFWDSGKLPDGRMLPDTARLVFRCLGGNIVLAPPGSPFLSQLPEFYLEDIHFFQNKAEMPLLTSPPVTLPISQVTRVS